MAYARVAAPPPPAPTPDVAQAGTPESRTLAAALTYFRDHVLIENPEECQDGTWITAAQALDVIGRLERV
jgi:hypothetical protein